MDEKAANLAARVYKPGGIGVTVMVLDLDGDGTPIFQHMARTWEEVDYWLADQGVPLDQVDLEPDAKAVLGPRPNPSS